MDEDGELDEWKYQQCQRYLAYSENQSSSSSDDDNELLLGSSHTSKANLSRQQRRRPKRSSSTVCEYIDSDGVLRRLLPHDSNWYFLYVRASSSKNTIIGKKIRRRFRLPYNSYLELLEEAKAKDWFPCWTRAPKIGRSCSPLELMILGALRYLGRGWTFDNIEESTGIDEETHRQFLHLFIKNGSTALYEKSVRTPGTVAEAPHHTHKMEIAGFPGCISSTDATHIVIEKCQARICNAHMGPKLAHTVRTYHIQCNCKP